MENQPFDWEELLICMGDKRVIPVIGKELLVVEIDGEKRLLESFLARRLAEELDLPLDRLPADAQLNDVAMLLYDCHGERRKLYSRLRSIMQQHDFPIPENLRKLGAITDFGLYVSLTFDSLLLDAIDSARFDGARNAIPLVYSPNREVQDIPDNIVNLKSPYVFQIFGQLSSTTDYAVTDEDVLEFTHALQTENRPKLLFDELRKYHLLFLGCGFSNWLERFVVRTISNNRMLTRETYGFIADEGVRSDVNLTVFLKHYKTEVFLAGLTDDFVDELYRRWCDRNPALCSGDVKARADGSQAEGQSPGGQHMRPGAVFLSYASEDVIAARNLKDALTKAGLDVWFDKKRLTPGTAWDAEIQRNIRRCSFFIPLISRNAQARREGYFRKEWRWAIDRSEGMDESLKFLYPVIIDDTPEMAESIPRGFWRWQGARFSEGKPSEEFISELVQEYRERQLREHRLK